MNTSLKAFYTIAMLFASQVAIADTTPSKEALIHLTTSSEVREQLSKLPPMDRKKLEATIIIGNKFIQKHFDHAAYEADPENVDWTKNVAPLVSMGVTEWRNQDWMPVTKEIKLGEKIVGGTRLTCSQVTLVSVMRSNGVVTMEYRAAIIAMLIDVGWWGDWMDLFPEQGVYEVSIELNTNNQIFEVTAQDHVITTMYTTAISFMNTYLANPRHFSGFGETQADTESKVLRYKKLIEQMNQRAVRICK